MRKYYRRDGRRVKKYYRYEECHRIVKGGQREAVAGLPDLSLPSKESKKVVATGTNNRPVDTVQNGSEKLTLKLTSKLTPIAYSGCNRSATVGNGQNNFQKNVENDNCLSSGELDNKSDSLSVNDTHKKETRLEGLEPPTSGSVDRRSIQLSYRRLNV